MKRKIILVAVMFILMAWLTGCNNLLSNDNEGKNYDSSIPVKVDSDILQACYDYTEFLGYEITDKNNYTSVLLEKSQMDYVYMEDDTRSDMLDENDYLIIFKEIKIVIDVDTGIALGHIPYV